LKNPIIPYNPKLKAFASYLRKNSTLAEIILWKEIKAKAMGVEFHRQVPIDEFIVDFYCHELRLVIEVDGNSHDFKYEYDQQRQMKLEDLGLTIVRFGDQEIKRDMFNVLRALEITISRLKTEKKGKAN
jgi:very-short-patch-repair endonuclease